MKPQIYMKICFNESELYIQYLSFFVCKTPQAPEPELIFSLFLFLAVSPIDLQELFFLGQIPSLYKA